MRVDGLGMIRLCRSPCFLCRLHWPSHFAVVASLVEALGARASTVAAALAAERAAAMRAEGVVARGVRASQHSQLR